MNFTHFDPSKSKLVFDGIVCKIYHRHFGDKVFEYIIRPDGAKVIAVTASGKIALLREKNFSHDKQYLSLPGGAVEPLESPEETAKRELLEETGLKPAKLELWFAHNYSQTIINKRFFYVAQGCEQIASPEHEETENIGLLLLDFDDFLKAVIQPTFVHTELQNEFLKMHLDAKLRDVFRAQLGV